MEALQALRQERDKLKEAVEHIEGSIAVIERLYGSSDSRNSAPIPAPATSPKAANPSPPADAHPGHAIAPPKAARKPPAPPAPSTGEDITLDEAAQLTGLNKMAVKNRKHQGTFTTGSKRGTVTRSSVLDHC